MNLITSEAELIFRSTEQQKGPRRWIVNKVLDAADVFVNILPTFQHTCPNIGESLVITIITSSTPLTIFLIIFLSELISYLN